LSVITVTAPWTLSIFAPGTLAAMSHAAPPTDRLPAVVPRRRPGPLPGVVLVAAGVVVTIVGTFLPWVVSGGVTRTSYAVAGLLDRLQLFRSDWVTGLLKAWPVVGPLCVVPVVLLIVRLWRPAGWVATLVGAAVVAATVTVLVYAADWSFSVVELDLIGPVITIVGGVLLIGGGLVLGLSRRR
jgi:hypothetical protein